MNHLLIYKTNEIMTKYTIGIVFDEDLNRVILLEKTRPDWQKGRLNCPGGHIEIIDGIDEGCIACVKREFMEECGIDIHFDNWNHIGKITNNNTYSVDVLTAIVSNATIPLTLTEEKVKWYNVKDLPHNVLSNIKWLVPFAINWHQQGNNDSLKFGWFEYE